MASVSPAARLVEVIADRGESAADRYRYGSGCIVRGRTVLTAAHVVAGAQRVQVRDPDKKLYLATVDPRFVGDANGPGPDLALVEIDDPAVDLAPMGLARVDRDAPTDEPVRCRAIGYPWFAETPSPTAMRDTVDAIGVVPVLSKLAAGLLSVQVSISPRPLPPEDKSLAESEWSGMSGAPVVAAGRLLGVVTEHAPREGPSAITAVPLTALAQDPAHLGWGPGVKDPSAWWTRLGVTGLSDLQRLPAALPERPTLAYWETVREFGRTLHRRMPQLLGREQELAEIAAFATGPAGYRWLVGGAYAGKTALLFEAVTAGLPDEVDVVCYFLSRRASDADSSRFLAAVVPQLAYLCEIDPPVADRDQFYALWARAAEPTAQTGRPLLLVVDGLDEDVRPTGLPSVASLLPTLVVGRAHVLVTSRPHPDLPVDVPDGHPLQQPTIRVDLKAFKGAERQADRARQEIYSLTHGADTDTAVDVLGLLTAAAGPLSVRDLALLSNDLAPPSPAQSRRVRRLITEQAARSLEPIGSPEQPRYQFAHYSLLEYALQTEELGDPEYRNWIHQWAGRWRDRGWPTSTDAAESTPRYLLDSYPGVLASEPGRLAALVSDVGWVDLAIQAMGVDRILADLRRAAAADPAEPKVKAMLATVSGQAHHLRSPSPLTQAGYVLRQLCMQALELAEDPLAANLRSRLRSLPDPGPIPLWTTRRANRALIADLGRRHDKHGHGTRVQVAALPDGRVVSGGEGGQLQVWNPREPGAGPVELSVHDDFVLDDFWVLWVAVAVLPDGRIISGSTYTHDGRVRIWDPNSPEAGPTELGRQDRVSALAALEDGRVVSGDIAGRLLVWNPSQPGAEPVELGWCMGRVLGLAALEDGRVVSGDFGGRVLVWNPSQPGAGPVELGRHEDPVFAVAGLRGGRLASGGWDRRVLVWDLAAAGTAPVELGRHGGAVRAVAGLQNGRVVSGGDDRRLLVWILDPRGAGPVEFGRHDDPVSTMAELPNGQVVSGDLGGRLLVWDPDAPGVRPVESGVRVGEVLAMAALEDGRVVGCDDMGRLLVWDPAAGDAELVDIGRHDRRAQAVAVLRSGRVVSGDDAGRLLVWKIDEPAAGPVELVGHSEAVRALAVLPDGRLVSGDLAGRLLVWEHPDEPEARPRELGNHGGWVSGLVALQDRWVVSGGYDGRMHGVNEYAGRLLVWDPDAPDAEPVELGSHRQRVRAVAELGDGRVVSGWADGLVLVWDRSAPEAEPIEVGRHDGPVEAVAVLPNGQVLTGGDDRSVRLWDVQSKQCSWSVGCSVRALTAVVPSSGETLLVIAHQGTGVSTWSIRDAGPRAPQQ